jgi:hypothetical protein
MGPVAQLLRLVLIFHVQLRMPMVQASTKLHCPKAIPVAEVCMSFSHTGDRRTHRNIIVSIMVKLGE